MAATKGTTARADHAEHPNYEAALTGVMALANLFSNCVEAFNLVHPGQRFDKQEQLLITALGIQQARLLIWGDVAGISSPPPTVTDRAVPQHPSAAYPDLKEPTFFGARDARLEEPDTRQKIDDALSAIVDRSAHTSREEMMELYGLKPPKRFTVDYQPALDLNRLEAFRERYELLKEVAESYAHINTRRNSSIVSTSWTISDQGKFAGFIKLTKEKIDHLIALLENREQVDRAMCMDIRALGWHLSADRARIAADVSKLKLIQEACQDEYPEYVDAVHIALKNIDRERKENAADYNPYTSVQYAPINDSRVVPVVQTEKRPSLSAASGGTNGATNGANAKEHHKKHGLFGGLFSKRRSSHQEEKTRSLSVTDAHPPRAMSDAGPLPVTAVHTDATEPETAAPEPTAAPIRSKSVGDILDAPINSAEHEETRNRLEQIRTNATTSTVADDEAPPPPPASEPEASGDPREALVRKISRHDMYRGLARQGTKTQWD